MRIIRFAAYLKATPRHKSAGSKAMKLWTAIVEKQYPAVDETPVFKVIGCVVGTYSECWKEAKKLTPWPVLQFKEVRNDH
jgi:hypothetical protein